MSLQHNPLDMNTIEGNIIRPDFRRKKVTYEGVEARNLDEEIKAEILAAVESVAAGKLKTESALESISNLLDVYRK
jgi:hypothetical protein